MYINGEWLFYIAGLWALIIYVRWLNRRAAQLREEASTLPEINDRAAHEAARGVRKQRGMK